MLAPIGLLLAAAVHAQSGVLITNFHNDSWYYPAAQAAFGPPATSAGVGGLMVDFVDNDGCIASRVIDQVNVTRTVYPQALTTMSTMVAVMSRGNCTFWQKVANA